MFGIAGEVHPENQEINESTRSLVDRLCDLKTNALSVFGYTGSMTAPDEATLKEEVHALQCTAAGPHNAILTDLLRVVSVCGLGPDIHRIHTLSLAARCRTASNSGTLANGPAKNQAVREYDHAPIYALSSEWKEKFSNPSMAQNTVEACEIVCRLDHNGKLEDSPQDKKPKGWHGLAPRRTTKAGLCQTSVFTCLQSSWASQSFSHCTDDALNDSCITCFSPRANCWSLTHPLRWSLYGAKISHRGRGTEVSSWMPG